MKRAVIAAALLLAPFAASAEEGDIPWYAANPAARHAKLAWCRQDAMRQDTRECRNANAAGAVEMITPGDPWARLRAYEPLPRPAPQPVPEPPTPVSPSGRGPVRGT